MFYWHIAKLVVIQDEVTSFGNWLATLRHLLH